MAADQAEQHADWVYAMQLPSCAATMKPHQRHQQSLSHLTHSGGTIPCSQCIQKCTAFPAAAAAATCQQAQKLRMAMASHSAAANSSSSAVAQLQWLVDELTGERDRLAAELQHALADAATAAAARDRAAAEAERAEAARAEAAAALDAVRGAAEQGGAEAAAADARVAGLQVCADASVLFNVPSSSAVQLLLCRECFARCNGSWICCLQLEDLHSCTSILLAHRPCLPLRACRHAWHRCKPHSLEQRQMLSGWQGCWLPRRLLPLLPRAARTLLVLLGASTSSVHAGQRRC